MRVTQKSFGSLILEDAMLFRTCFWGQIDAFVALVFEVFGLVLESRKTDDDARLKMFKNV